MPELNNQELDIGYSRGFLETWADGLSVPEVRAQVIDNLKILVSGVDFYRQKFLDIQEDFNKLQNDFNRLTALSAQYLSLMQQQKEQIDELLIEGRRDLHRLQE